MSFRQDYLMQQIEKLAQIVAAIVFNKKADQVVQGDVDVALASLTGFDKNFFANNPLPDQLRLIFSLLNDDNKKALAYVLLRHKNLELYDALCKKILSGIARDKLTASVLSLLESVIDGN